MKRSRAKRSAGEEGTPEEQPTLEEEETVDNNPQPVNQVPDLKDANTQNRIFLPVVSR